MDLQPYLTRIATDLDRVTSLADESTRETSRRLAAALEPGLRLAMTELLADSAAELSARLGGTVIAVQMAGQSAGVAGRIACGPTYETDSRRSGRCARGAEPPQRR